jgi:pyridoxal phosphate enzyme (YggS family)
MNKALNPVNNINEALSIILKRVNQTAMRSDRNPDSVKVVAVSKFVSVEAIKEALNAGLRDFGESSVQDAVKKAETITAYDPVSQVSWHLIGHLQKNKAKTAVKVFDLIHSLDSVELALELDKHSGEISKVQRVLLQVKMSAEKTKSGAEIDTIEGILTAVCKLQWLKLEGFMLIPPYFDDPELARPYFRRLRELRDSARDMGYDAGELSMGMSHDFEVAIEEGATIIRPGSAIFGERPPKDVSDENRENEIR